MTVQRGSEPELRAHACKVLSLDGKRAYVELSGFPALTDAVTIEFWARGSGGPKTSVFAAGVGSERIIHVHLPWRGRIYWDAGTVSDHDRVESPIGELPVFDAWTHWAFVKDVSREWMGFYCNGELVVEGTGRGLGFDKPDVALVGAYLGHKHCWGGALSELRIWRVARTRVQLRQAMHQRATGQEIGLVGYWPFDEGEGDRAIDRTSYANDGILHHASWIDAELQLATAQAMPATGLDDYSYWHRWSRMLERRGEEDDGKPFRRGRIWS